MFMLFALAASLLPEQLILLHLFLAGSHIHIIVLLSIARVAIEATGAFPPQRLLWHPLCYFHASERPMEPPPTQALVADETFRQDRAKAS